MSLFPKRKWLRIVLVVLGLGVLLVGPWPASRSHFAGSAYARDTFGRIADLPLPPAPGQLMVGAAAVEITPPIGEPLAGFGSRRPNRSRAAKDKLFARAISLSTGGEVVTILGGDLLLFLPKLRDAVLGEAHLSRAQVYFTATHTHCGPGGFAPRWIDELAGMGNFSQEILERLSSQFAEAILASRAALEPASFASGSVAVSGVVENRILDVLVEDAPLMATTFTSVDGRHLASWVTFDAHPVTLGRRDMEAGGSYPATLVAAIEEDLGGMVLFAAGAVGSMTVSGHAEARGPGRRDWIVGELLAPARDLLTRLGMQANSTDAVVLRSDLVSVDLPPVQFRLGKHLKVSPITSAYLHSRSSSIHRLQLGATVLLGMPADYSAELAASLRQVVQGTERTVFVTSFNGDYIGYLLPEARYDSGHYEATSMNFFGPWCGVYFTELSRALLAR